MRSLFYKSVLLLIVVFQSDRTCQAQQAMADSFLHFLHTHKTNASVYITRNDTIITRLNEDKLMPLASTVKLMVAVEFAKQAGSHIIDEESYVPLAELNKYYIPFTDGGAHPNWLQYEKEKNHVVDEKIKLIDVARGMMMFSSNANTEYLMDLLGFDNVKNNIQLFGFKYHTSIYPLVSSLFMYQNPRQMPETKIVKAIKKFSDEQYSRYIAQIHAQLKIDSFYKTRFRPQDLTEEMLKLWSSRLTASTAKEYVQLARILNNRKFFNEYAYGVLAQIVEFPMEHPDFLKTFKHYGAKSGSTSYVLAHVVYFTSKDDVKMEMAIFLNNLNPKEQQQAEKWLLAFEGKIITDPGFRQKLVF